MLKGFVLGIIVTLLGMVAGAYVVVKLGLMPAGQDQKPGKLETWAAKTSLAVRIGREAKTLHIPMEPTEPNLTAGASLYVANCQVCHGAADARASRIAQGLTPDPPQLAKDGVEDDPEGETYSKIKHGIRFTGMPGYGQTLSESQIWQLALFLKHMDALPAGTRIAWAAARP